MNQLESGDDGVNTDSKTTACRTLGGAERRGWLDWYPLFPKLVELMFSCKSYKTSNLMKDWEKEVHFEKPNSL